MKYMEFFMYIVGGFCIGLAFVALTELLVDRVKSIFTKVVKVDEP